MRSQQVFLRKGQMVNILDLGDHVASVTTIQLCHSYAKEATDDISK